MIADVAAIVQYALRRTVWTAAEEEERESRPPAREKHDEDGGRALKTPGRAVPRGIREDPPPTGTLSGSLSHKEQGLRGGVLCSQETVFHLVKLVYVMRVAHHSTKQHTDLRPDVRDPKRGARGSNFDRGVGTRRDDGTRG